MIAKYKFFPTYNYFFLHFITFSYVWILFLTYTYTETHTTTMYSFSIHGLTMYGDVGKVGKKIPLTTLWLGVVKGIQFVDTVRLGGMV